MSIRTKAVIVVSSLLAALAGATVVGPATPVAATPHPDTVDLDSLNMVPLRTWGVSGQDPDSTQTETIDNLVWDFAQIGNRMFVGGAFLNVQENADATPIPQAYLAAFDVDSGDWVSTWTPQIDRAVYSLDVLADGSLLVGGEFESVNGQARKGVVALDPLTGAIDPDFAGSVDRPWSSRRAVVRQVDVDNDRVYVAGNFSHFNGINGSRSRMYKVGRFDQQGVIDPTWKPQVTGASIWGLDTDRSRNEVHLSGFFTAVNGEADSGHFHTVNDSDGATAPGKIEMPRNLPGVQEETYDVVYGDGVVFAVGEQHILQVLDADDHNMLGWHSTGLSSNTFTPQGYFAGGAYQVGERIGDVVFSGCHCTYSTRNGYLNHYSSFDGERTPHRLVMAYEASTGELIDQFMPDIHSPRDGTWAVGSDTNGCLYIGGDFHVGGVDAGTPRWLGGFAKLCGDGPRVDGLLVESDARWRYDDSGTDHGTAWREPGFDDQAWSQGRGKFGFGDGDENRVLASGQTTYYFRRSFQANGPLPTSLDLRLLADDGAVVYLNGTEVLRDNMPDGLVTARTKAIDWRSNSEEILRTFIVSGAPLVEGENVLAVEVHNIWSGNNDLEFSLHLGTSNEVVEPPNQPLIDVGADWDFADSSVGPPAGWPAAPLPANSGTAEFGFGDGGEITELTAGEEAYYFSRQFEVTGAADIAQLTLCMIADDGAVVYLNGTEVLRTNMPDGVIEPTTRPLAWIGLADEVYIDHVIAADALVEGTNLVTAEVHNFWPGNLDLSFDLCLRKG